MPRQMHPGPRLDVPQMAIPMNGVAQEGKSHFMAALVNSSSPSSISDRLHFAVTNQNISRFRCSVGKDNRACKNLLSHCSLFPRKGCGRTSCPGFLQQVEPNVRRSKR